MKFAKVGFVFLMQLSLITSVSIKSPHERTKEGKTHNDNAISLAEAVAKLQAMKLADSKHNKSNFKPKEKPLNKKVIPETTMATFTEIYQLDTTVILQDESELITNGHIAARGEAILDQAKEEPSETEDVTADQTSESEKETITKPQKIVAVKNQDVAKDTPELDNQQNRMNHDGTVPNISQGNQFIPKVKTKIHQHLSQQGRSSVAKEIKINHASDHNMLVKSKVSQSSNHLGMEPHNKVVTDTHVADKSSLENKLINSNMKIHGNINHHQASLTHKISNLPVSSHNPINHNRKSKIEKVNHEITPKKVSQPKLSDYDTSQEDTASVDLSKEEIEEIDGSELINNSKAGSELIDESKADSKFIDESKKDTNLKEFDQEGAGLANSLTEDNDSLNPSAEDTKKLNSPNTSSLNVDSDTEEKGVPMTDNNSAKLSSLEKTETEDTNKNKINKADHKPFRNRPKHLQRKTSIMKLPHKTNDVKDKNLDHVNIEVDPKVAIEKINKPEAGDTSQRNTEPESPEPKHQMKLDPVMLKTELKHTNLHDNLKDKENDVTGGKENAVTGGKEKTNNKNQDSKGVLNYLKHESQVSHRKESVSSNYIIAVTMILIVSTILFTIVGVYYRQIRIDRQKYIGHMLLETAEDDEDMQLFNRQTYHDDATHGYESWNAIR